MDAATACLQSEPCRRGGSSGGFAAQAGPGAEAEIEIGPAEGEFFELRTADCNGLASDLNSAEGLVEAHGRVASEHPAGHAMEAAGAKGAGDGFDEAAAGTMALTVPEEIDGVELAVIAGDRAAQRASAGKSEGMAHVLRDKDGVVSGGELLAPPLGAGFNAEGGEKGKRYDAGVSSTPALHLDPCDGVGIFERGGADREFHELQSSTEARDALQLGLLRYAGERGMRETGERLTPLQHRAQNRCFGCGPANPAGLRLEFLLAEDGSVVCFARVSENYEGPAGYLHGGIIASLLDETMSKSVRAKGFTAMTRHIEVDYLRPVPSRSAIRLEGRTVGSDGRKHHTEAKILNEAGETLAKGKGLFIEVKPRENTVGRSEDRPTVD